MIARNEETDRRFAFDALGTDWQIETAQPLGLFDAGRVHQNTRPQELAMKPLVTTLASLSLLAAASIDAQPPRSVSALIAMNRPDQLRSHLALARTNGVTRDERLAGWPSAVTAVGVAKEVLPPQ